MSLNGSGVAVINSAGQPVVATTLITATAFNALTADLATMISTCLMKDGQQTVTANIPLNTYKLTGVGDGSALQDAATLKNLQNATGIYVATVGGTADAVTLTPSPAITAYAAGQTFRFIASGANTTNVTAAVSGLVAKAVTKNGATALVAGDIPSGTMVSLTYDGTRFILAGGPFLPVTGGTLTGALTTNGQVVFPASQNASAEANTLDDYEEGTWTPTVGGNATYTTQTGTYTKIGRLVTLTCNLFINVLGTGSAATISGLPFTVGAFSGYGAVEWQAAAGSFVTILARATTGTTTVQLLSATAAATGLTVGASVLGNSAVVRWTVTFEV